MAEKLFPQRKRCKRCSKGLGLHYSDSVLFGLYCSTACAGIPVPPTNPADAPRECVTQRDGQWQFKRRYRSEVEIPDKLRQDPSTSWYWCNVCGHLHIGHTRMGEAEKFRIFMDAADLCDTLVKVRGKASIKDVARAAGVRPVRLKELEQGIGHLENLQTLFKVASVLGLRFGVSLQVEKNK